MKRHALIAGVLVLSILPSAACAQRRRTEPPPPAAPGDTSTFGQLRYRYIGPVGNRVTSAAGIPGDPSTYYVGAGSGGVWKTTDGGVTWEPVFDEQPVQSIGSLAAAPPDPHILLARTRADRGPSHHSIGHGLHQPAAPGK